MSDDGRGRRRPRSPEEPYPYSDKDNKSRGRDEPRKKAFRRESDDSSERYARDRAYPSTSKREQRLTSREEQPSTSKREQRLTSREEQPSTSKREQRLTSREEQPSTSRGPAGDAPRTERVATKRDRYEIVHTRPADVHTKKGTDGKTIQLKSNYYRLLTKPSWNIYQYCVDFEPEMENRRVRSGMLYGHRQRFGGYIYDGKQLFSSTKLEEDKIILKAQSKDEVEFTITIKKVGLISMTDWQSLQVLNLIIRRAMEGLKLQLVGRNYFDAHSKMDMREYNLQLWPGYETSIRQHEREILLCAELTFKVMRTETVYDIMNQISRRPVNFQEEFRRAVIGLVVLTDYNNKTYRVNDVDFGQNPKSTFDMKGTPISFVDYYNKKYHIRLRDVNQPLLISKAKDKAQSTRSDEFVILIPELCRATGLTDNMRANFKLQRAMGEFTRMRADRRMERLEQFNRRLQSTPDSMRLLQDWNMTLDKELVDVTGRIISEQNIVLAGRNKISAGERADWSMAFRNNGMFTTPSDGLKRWGVIAQDRCMRDLQRFLNSLSNAANGMGFRINRPTEFVIRDDRNSSYVQALDQCCCMDPQIILCLVPNNNVERYNSIKKKTYIDRGIPSQIITMRVVNNQRGLMSIASKVAIQMNAKLGYTPWAIEIPTSGLMTVGYDLAKSTQNRNTAYGALVASMDLQSNATFFSTVVECNAHDLMANSLWPMLMKALRRYREEHKSLPTRIVFYRDGVSSGSLKQVYEYEVKDIVQKLQETYKQVNADSTPMLAYIVVTKNMNTRFFARERDPPPGTVVDDVVTLPECYDYYLVSQFVTQGTVSPTRYNVLYNNAKLSPDKLQKLTYKMTHLYYNWSGTTRVPSVCQYAKKLATLVATNLHNMPHNRLEKKFYYL